MVFVNDKKFACEACIKGHRSSSCHHTDRPLFEVKKKGRPVSQCERCRELRNLRRVHSKCICYGPKDAAVATSPTASAPSGPSNPKPRRFVPIAPALPNGLKDMQVTSALAPPDVRQTVNSLLNPCRCKSVWTCKCRTQFSENGRAGPRTGLEALAHAASLQSGHTGHAKQDGSPPRTPPHKRRKSLSPLTSPAHDLPPLHLDADSPPPAFSTIPSISTITELAGSGCTCGFKCACPGCVEHRGASHASKDHSDCTQRCGHCVDHTIGIALPEVPTVVGPSSGVSMSTSMSSSVLDRFFASAAALPPPPRTRGSAIYLRDKNAVKLPKLCCGGRCACPEGQCSCGNSCDGGCNRHQAKGRLPNEVSGSAKEASALPTPSALTTGEVKKSCCCS